MFKKFLLLFCLLSSYTVFATPLYDEELAEYLLDQEAIWMSRFSIAQDDLDRRFIFGKIETYHEIYEKINH